MFKLPEDHYAIVTLTEALSQLEQTQAYREDNDLQDRINAVRDARHALDLAEIEEAAERKRIADLVSAQTQLRNALNLLGQ